MVEGASGHLEGEENRMVKTPWFQEEIPFVDAARIGTEKVIKDHATIGIVVTTDGSIGELERENYIAPEQTTVSKLQEIGKPFIIVLNTQQPYSSQTAQLQNSLEEQYGARVIPVNCQQMRREDIISVLKELLYEFPVTRIDYMIPEWTQMLPLSHEVKSAIIESAKNSLRRIDRVREVETVFSEMSPDEKNIFSEILLQNVNLAEGTVSVRMNVKDEYYFSYISEMTGTAIESEYQMIAMFRSLAEMKHDYERVKTAMESVEQKGYGVVMPGLSDISMEEPVVISHGGKYGIKMRAISPSIHMIKANIETEIAPIVGSEEQANDLIEYIKAADERGEDIWTTNIFGKTVGDLMEDGIRSKITQMDDECQLKLQDTMQKIVNDSSGGMVCIII
jgi:stage IV sporulation protein A